MRCKICYKLFHLEKLFFNNNKEFLQNKSYMGLLSYSWVFRKLMSKVSIFIAKGWLRCYFRFVLQALKFKNSIFLVFSRYLGIKKSNWPRENLSWTDWYLDCSFILKFSVVASKFFLRSGGGSFFFVTPWNLRLPAKFPNIPVIACSLIHFFLTLCE